MNVWFFQSLFVSEWILTLTNKTTKKLYSPRTNSDKRKRKVVNTWIKTKNRWDTSLSSNTTNGLSTRLRGSRGFSCSCRASATIKSTNALNVQWTQCDSLTNLSIGIQWYNCVRPIHRKSIAWIMHHRSIIVRCVQCQYIGGIKSKITRISYSDTKAYSWSTSYETVLPGMIVS